MCVKHPVMVLEGNYFCSCNLVSENADFYIKTNLFWCVDPCSFVLKTAIKPYPVPKREDMLLTVQEYVQRTDLN